MQQFNRGRPRALADERNCSGATGCAHYCPAFHCHWYCDLLRSPISAQGKSAQPTQPTQPWVTGHAREAALSGPFILRCLAVHSYLMSGPDRAGKAHPRLTQGCVGLWRGLLALGYKRRPYRSLNPLGAKLRTVLGCASVSCFEVVRSATRPKLSSVQARWHWLCPLLSCISLPRVLRPVRSRISAQGKSAQPTQPWVTGHAGEAALSGPFILRCLAVHSH